MTNHYTDVCEETIESLRQQLDAALQQAELGKIFTGTFFVQIEQLEHQLSDSQKREVMLRDALDQLLDDMGDDGLCVCEAAKQQAKEALAATADLEGLRLCHAEPCRDDGRCQYAIDHGAEWLGHCLEGKCCMPLYRAWEPK